MKNSRVAEYRHAQPTTRMAWTNFHSAAYAEKLSDILQPKPDPRGPDTLVFAVPL